MLQVALNGRDHPATPYTPTELAIEAAAAVAAGAHVVHFHVYERGRETFAPGPTAAALNAVRHAAGVPLSLSTSAAIEPDPGRRLAALADWTELPDLVTANQGEPGIVELCEHLLDRGVGIEAGLLRLEDARAFVASGLGERCARVLLEPLDADRDAACEHAAAMEAVLADAGIALEQVHHGDGIASWAVNWRAAKRGHGVRTGLEDTPVLPDGTLARGNAELVAAAAALLSAARGEQQQD